MKLLSMNETADLLDISYERLRLLILNKEQHPPFLMVGKVRKFDPKQVQDWIVSQSEK